MNDKDIMSAIVSNTPEAYPLPLEILKLKIDYSLALVKLLLLPNTHFHFK